jgi:hypothetical protein
MEKNIKNTQLMIYETAKHWYLLGVSDTSKDFPEHEAAVRFKDEYGSLFDEHGFYAPPCDETQDMEVLKNKLADREGSAYYETGNAREESFRNGWDACLDYITRKDRADFAALYKELSDQEKQKNDNLKKKISEALHWIHEGKTGNAIQILNHLYISKTINP